MDMFDMKPDGPAHVRGEFQPIKTNVSGTHICELLPRLAGLADKYTIIRSVVGNINAHNFDTTQLGYRGLRMKDADMRSIGGAPAVGSIISKILGPRDGVPAFVWDRNGGSQESVQTGYLGPSYRPFEPGRGRQAYRRRLAWFRDDDEESLIDFSNFVIIIEISSFRPAQGHHRG